ncbi:MAG: hypothetical protein LBI54_02220 [Lachnospiraceae bacterium]|jgi:hypothetical protein|nr:hypothetical protein [Lachnospiraceae bacterium]
MYYCLNCGKKLTTDEEDGEFCSQCQEEGYGLAEPAEEEGPESAAQAAKKALTALRKPWLGLIPFVLSLVCFLAAEAKVSPLHPLAAMFGHPLEPRAFIFAIATFVTVILTFKAPKQPWRALVPLLAALWAIFVSFHFFNPVGDALVTLAIGFVLGLRAFVWVFDK